MMLTKEQIEATTRRLVDEGLLIEAGWVSLRLTAIPFDAPQVQLDEMRQAFFAGAQHLFSSILFMVEEGNEPTAADERRLEQIHKELGKFIEGYGKKHGLG